MSAAYHDRIQRLRRLEALLPKPGTKPADCLDGARLGHGKQIRLVIRVRGYLTQLLLDCPLTDQQTCEDEPKGSGFVLRIQASLPQTGQLLRWLLGAGNNLEVLEPQDLRHIVAEQARKMAAVYPPAPAPTQAPVVTMSTGAADDD